MTEEPIGSVLAGYRLEELIGRGGMSAVYRAEHVHLGKKVALKILSPALAMDEDFRERFLRESRTAASIEHPNIIPIYDAGEVDGRLYIAMRHVEGLDLKQLIERDGRSRSAAQSSLSSRSPVRSTRRTLSTLSTETSSQGMCWSPAGPSAYS